MKCSFCNVNFTPTIVGQEVCDDCLSSVEELTNGKGDDEDD